MNRPRLFLSAVSEELLSARKAVAATVRKLGFDPVSQDDFPTGYGELRKWLREQVDSCEGLIQLVGQGYGAESTEVDPGYGRVSYTQLEFLYASAKGKKTWVIVIGEGCRRDKPIDQLDLPREVLRSDPAAHQAERQASLRLPGSFFIGFAGTPAGPGALFRFRVRTVRLSGPFAGPHPRSGSTACR